MNRSLSWIDPKALSAALEKAGVDTGRPSQARTAPARAVRQPARGTRFTGPPLIEPAGGDRRKSLRQFRSPDGTLEDRLEALLAWVSLETGCRTIFILDEEGLVLMEKSSDPTLVAISSSFINFHERIRSSLGSESQGSITIDVEAGKILHLLQVATRLGRYVLGFIVAEPVPRLRVRRFQTALAQALEGV